MTLKTKLESIPRGATARGVNRAVIEYLLEHHETQAPISVLDIPCGQGDFLHTLQSFFPSAQAHGCDLTLPDKADTKAFSAVDASRTFSVFDGKQFNCIISISGVMEFDNTLQFFESCEKQLTEAGTLIVTNDNLITLRDRLEYLLFGKVRQYSIFLKSGEPTWKILPIQNLCRILHDAGFKATEIRYVSMKSKDWVWLPLALPIYALQYLYMMASRTDMTLRQKLMLYPFKSLFFRHYLIICQKRGAAPDVLPEAKSP